MYRFIEKYLLCHKCKYPETSMFIRQKKLMSKCRACGHEMALDSFHKAGIQLIKQLPKDMSEIDVQKKEVKPQEVKSEDEEDKKDKKKKKKLEEKDEEVSQEDGMTINSEEIGKSTTAPFLSSNHSFNLMMNTLSLPLIFLTDYNWFCNAENILLIYFSNM